MGKLKTFDLAAGEFNANGKTYYIEEGLSIERYRKYEEIEIEMGFGRNLAEVFDDISKATALINTGMFGDGHFILRNLRDSAGTFKSKRPHVFRFCALFMNTFDEDRGKISEDMINKKISDWQTEGLDYRPFFTFAINSLPGYMERFKSLTLPTSNPI